MDVAIAKETYMMNEGHINWIRSGQQNKYKGYFVTEEKNYGSRVQWSKKDGNNQGHSRSNGQGFKAFKSKTPEQSNDIEALTSSMSNNVKFAATVTRKSRFINIKTIAAINVSLLDILL